MIDYSNFTNTIHRINNGTANFNGTIFDDIEEILRKTREILYQKKYTYEKSHRRQSTKTASGFSGKIGDYNVFVLYFDIVANDNIIYQAGLGYSLYDFVSEFLGGTLETPGIIPWRLLILNPSPEMIKQIKKNKLEDEIRLVDGKGRKKTYHPFLRIDNSHLPHSLGNNPNVYAQQLADSVDQFIKQNFEESIYK